MILRKRLLAMSSLVATANFRSILTMSQREALYNDARITIAKMGGGERQVPASSVVSNLSRDAVDAISLLDGDEAEGTIPSTFLKFLSNNPQWFVVSSDETVKLTPLAVAAKDSRLAVDASALGGRYVTISGHNVTATFDTQTPILTSKEIEDMALDRLFWATSVQYLRRRNLSRKLFEDGNEPPPIREFEEYDGIYERRGLLPPSHVAHFLIPLVPTFSVETGAVCTRMPPQQKDAFFQHNVEVGDGKYLQMSRSFELYPMIVVVTRNRYQKSLVKLNIDVACVRNHPSCGKADRSMRRFSKEYSPKRGIVSAEHARLDDVARYHTQTATMSSSIEQGQLPRHLRNAPAMSIDSKIFCILLQHVLADAKFQFVSLVQWVNKFSTDELSILNEVPQRRVLSIMQKYRRVFQLSTIDGSDPNFFFQERGEGIAETVSDGVALPLSSTSDIEAPEVDVAEGTLEEPSDEVVAKRVESFKAALQDELIGLEDLVSGRTEEVYDRGLGVSDTIPPCVESDEAVGIAGAFEGSEALATVLDTLTVRQLPPWLAPGSLSDWDMDTTRDPEILKHTLQFVSPPSEAGTGSSTALTPDGYRRTWRWVRIERIYATLSNEQRVRLKAHRGLVNFLRMHGRLFEVSADLCHVIWHDPSGAVPPFIPTQRDFSFEERVSVPQNFDLASNNNTDSTALFQRLSAIEDGVREKFNKILGGAQIPTTRLQLTLLDPRNPLLDTDVLLEEIRDFLPDHPVEHLTLKKRLPPMMQAAASSSTHRAMVQSPLFTFFDSPQHKKMVQKASLPLPPEAMDVGGVRVMSLAKAIRELEEVVRPNGGVPLSVVPRLLTAAAGAAIVRELGTVDAIAQAFPHKLVVRDEEKSGRVVPVLSLL